MNREVAYETRVAKCLATIAGQPCLRAESEGCHHSQWLSRECDMLSSIVTCINQDSCGQKALKYAINLSKIKNVLICIKPSFQYLFQPYPHLTVILVVGSLW